jgi:hypothetical protein
LQTFAEQKLDFLLRKDFCLPVSLDLHVWCIPTRHQKVCHKYCITASVDGDFLMR